MVWPGEPGLEEWVDPDGKRFPKRSVFTLSVYLIFYQTDNLFDPQFAEMKPLCGLCVVS